MSESRINVQEFTEALGQGWTPGEVLAEWVSLGLRPRTDWRGLAAVTVDEAAMAYAAITAGAAEAEAEVRAAVAERNAQQEPRDEYRFVREEVERKLRGYVSPGAIHGAQVRVVERIRQGEEPEPVIAEVVYAARLPVQATYFGR